MKPLCPNCLEEGSPHSIEHVENNMWKCHECRAVFPASIFASSKRGRPQIGETKTLKVTLSKECWKWIDECIQNGHAKSRSEFIRAVLEHAKGS